MFQKPRKEHIEKSSEMGNIMVNGYLSSFDIHLLFGQN